jgi:ferredoxin
MIRHITAREYAKAADIAGPEPSAEEDGSSPHERVCRRGRKDEPVAIDQLIRFAREQRADAQGKPQNARAIPEKEALFSVHMPSFTAEEMEAYSRSASDARQNVPANGRSFTPEEAQAEARRCLNCDCARAVTCRLRYWARRYGAKPGRWRRRHRSYARFDSPSGISYEPGKCIACGLCVDVAQEAGRGKGMTFLGRGYEARVAPPDASFAEALGDLAGICARVCPTAALIRKKRHER